MMLYEELGFCPEGRRRPADRRRRHRNRGRLPVNTSGGLISKGHPVGATGVSQIYEIWLQLRGEAGDRQVNGAKAGLTHNGGGMVRGESALTTVHVLSL